MPSRSGRVPGGGRRLLGSMGRHRDLSALSGQRGRWSLASGDHMRDAAGPSYPAARGRLAPMTTQVQPARLRIIRLV